MDTRRMISALLAALLVFYLWLMIARVIYPSGPEETGPDSSAVTTSGPSQESQPATGPATATRPGTAPTAPGQSSTATVQAQAGRAKVRGGSDTTPIVLGGAEDGSPYPMALEIQPVGAAVSNVRIRGHDESVDEDVPYAIIEPVKLSDEPGETSFAHSFVTRIRFDTPKLDAPLDEEIWTVTGRTEERVELSVDILAPPDESSRRTHSSRNRPRSRPTTWPCR